MALSNAERQRRYRERQKARNTGPNKEATVTEVTQAPVTERVTPAPFDRDDFVLTAEALLSMGAEDFQELRSPEVLHSFAATALRILAEYERSEKMNRRLALEVGKLRRHGDVVDPEVA